MSDFYPIDAPQVNERDVADLNAFMAGGDLRSPEQAIRLLCTLRSIVAHSGATDFPLACSDCFCNGNHMNPEHWRNTGDKVRYIIAASGGPLWLAVVMVVVGGVGAVLDARRHERRTGDR